MTEDFWNGVGTIQDIKNEFDLILLWQEMAKTFGIEARSAFDRYIALSLRKMLCNDTSPLVRICPEFKMPPLTGERFYCPGDDGSMKLVEIDTNIHVRPENEWIFLNDWLDEHIAWIEKGKDDVPKVISDSFYQLLIAKLRKTNFPDYYHEGWCDGKRVWKLDKPAQNSEDVYEILKANGYYDLTIRRMIKQIADKYCTAKEI